MKSELKYAGDCVIKKIKADMREKPKKYSLHLKRIVVSEIVDGNLFIQEAMDKYYISSKVTIINWLKKGDEYYFPAV